MPHHCRRGGACFSLPSADLRREDFHYAAEFWTGRRPVLLNQATARASAWSAGAGLTRSSRSALACVTHIFFFAMRTASNGTRGGWPETPAHAVLQAPAQNATRYGRRRVGAFPPVMRANFWRICARVRFSEPRM